MAPPPRPRLSPRRSPPLPARRAPTCPPNTYQARATSHWCGIAQRSCNIAQRLCNDVLQRGAASRNAVQHAARTRNCPINTCPAHLLDGPAPVPPACRGGAHGHAIHDGAVTHAARCMLAPRCAYRDVMARRGLALVAVGRELLSSVACCSFDCMLQAACSHEWVHECVYISRYDGAAFLSLSGSVENLFTTPGSNSIFVSRLNSNARRMNCGGRTECRDAITADAMPRAAGSVRGACNVRPATDPLQRTKRKRATSTLQRVRLRRTSCNAATDNMSTVGATWDSHAHARCGEERLTSTHGYSRHYSGYSAVRRARSGIRRIDLLYKLLNVLQLHLDVPRLHHAVFEAAEHPM